MNSNFEYSMENAAAFQKMWMESVSKLVQASFNFPPNTTPDAWRQVRSSMFRALGESWEQFMRSEPFLEGMKQWMDTAVCVRKMSSDFLAKARNEMQAPSRDDIDTVMLTVRHLENRLLDRLDNMAAQIATLESRTSNKQSNGRPGRRHPGAAPGRKSSTNKKQSP